MTATKKAPNYSEKQTQELVEAYENADTENERENVVEKFAAKFAKSTRSIRQKLVREEVYVKKTYKTKTGAKTERKENIVESIASAMGVESEQLSGLEKATKKTLELIRHQFIGAAKSVELAWAALEAQDADENSEENSS